MCARLGDAHWRRDVWGRVFVQPRRTVPERGSEGPPRCRHRPDGASQSAAPRRHIPPGAGMRPACCPIGVRGRRWSGRPGQGAGTAHAAAICAGHRPRSPHKPLRMSWAHDLISLAIASAPSRPAPCPRSSLVAMRSVLPNIFHLRPRHWHLCRPPALPCGYRSKPAPPGVLQSQVTGPSTRPRADMHSESCRYSTPSAPDTFIRHAH